MDYKMKKQVAVRSVGHKRKGGTHGSLNKAGKTRDMNPIRWMDHTRLTKEGDHYRHTKKHKSPRIKNRAKHHNRVVLYNIYHDPRRLGNKQ